MKKFEVIFMKIKTVKMLQNEPTQLLKQTIVTDNPDVLIKQPQGYALLSVCEILPEEIQKADVTKTKSINN
jgi:hypothetical protein